MARATVTELGDCSALDNQLPTCDIDGRTACTMDTNTGLLSCSFDIYDGSCDDSTVGVDVTVVTWEMNSDPHIKVAGTCPSSSGTRSFCCQWNEEILPMEELYLEGTDREDTIALTDESQSPPVDLEPNDIVSALDVEIHGEGGSDDITASPVNDAKFDYRLYGGGKRDHIIGSPLGDRIWGGDETPPDDGDRLEGKGGDDVIRGGDGNDDIFGNAGDDTLYGGDHRDFIAGNDGEDTIYAGPGNDTYLFGDDGDDTIHGDDGNDRIYGGPDADTCYGGAGNDTIYGEGGSDDILGGAGEDQLFGDDSVFFLDTSVNRLLGGLGDDLLYGAAGADVLFDHYGADEHDGRDGDDTICESWHDTFSALLGFYSDDEQGFFGGPGTDRVEYLYPENPGRIIYGDNTIEEVHHFNNAVQPAYWGPILTSTGSVTVLQSSSDRLTECVTMQSEHGAY
jgi:Ca2+-binding RTX toxin-like protein